ncbi:MAG: ABC transporter permease [Nocardioidaceae bacterium]
MSATTMEPAAAGAELGLAARRRLRNVGIVFLVIGFVTLFLWLKTASADAAFKLNDEIAPSDWWLLRLPGKTTVLICALVLLALGVVQLVRRLAGKWLVVLSIVAGLIFVFAFLCWAAAGRGEIAPGIPRSFALQQQFAGTLKLATPLILGALSGVLCERAGVINIAIEGQFLVAAFAAAVFGTIFQSEILGVPWVGIVVGILAGVLMAALLAVFAIRYMVNQVVLGVVLVLLATGLTGFLLDQIPSERIVDFNNPPILSSMSIPLLADIPIIGKALFEQSVLVYIMYVSVAFVTVLLFQTKWGLRVRSVGEHPLAADTVGIKVRLTRYQAVLMGGVFAGLGGAFFTVGTTGAFDKGQTSGNGFIALAALIMGRWHPIGATFGALFFGFMLELAQSLSVLQTPIPSEFLSMVPYLATVVAVAGLVGRVKPPAADGEPYVKG